MIRAIWSGAKSPDNRTWGYHSGHLRLPSPGSRDLRGTRCEPGCRRRPPNVVAKSRRRAARTRGGWRSVRSAGGRRRAR
ncbi:hypothetical protein FTUN_8174 [Frigoriglobus tundricola]|uniref:Uncharacterized protein n=1 Tax=Frigoriglobus tundricola TaxID=2774151 RepID=A0A6M5Z509_9BACT|nr:hypothetical protein FTUN_8174 [Frigoriglobus tundricola]